jgi:hypothetical protein
MAPNSGFSAPGQRERIVRGERTDPRVIIGQAAALAGVTLFGFVVVRLYIYGWDWINERELHGTFGPVAIILILACVIADIMLFVEIFDPNWPNPRDATDSTRPNFPWSGERQPVPADVTNVNVKVDMARLLDMLTVDDDEDDDEFE